MKKIRLTCGPGNHPEMKQLVELMNTMPGIVTYDGCGGHDDPVDEQLASGQWFLDFGLCEPYDLAMLSLDILARAVGRMVEETELFSYQTTALHVYANEDEAVFRISSVETEPDAFTREIVNLYGEIVSR